MTDREAKKISYLLKRAGTILLVTHRNPDGDGIGSGLALMNKLTKMGKKVDFINRDPMPCIYKFLPMAEKVQSKKCVRKKYDLIIYLECPDAERHGSIIKPENAKKTINIDHHMGNEMYADINIVEPKAPAVGFQLFHFMKKVKWKIDKSAAMGLYTAIITDTGSFSYSNTSPEVHMAAAELLKAGASPVDITSEVYATTRQSTALMMNMLSKLKIKGKVGWSVLTSGMFKKTRAKDNETDNFINSIRAIRGLYVAVLFKEYGPKTIKVSFRSKYGIDVNAIASKLDGGGHKYAAGCVVREPLKQAQALVLSLVNRQLSRQKAQK